MLELDGIAEQVDGDPHEWLRSLRAFAGRRRGDAVLLGEVNTGLKDLARFFGDEDGDQLNMQFAFLLNQNLWLSLAREEAEPLESMIRSLPDPPPDNALGHVPAQPRRAQPRQAHGAPARGGLRRFRARLGHAALRPRSAPAQRRRCWAATARGCGWPGA